MVVEKVLYYNFAIQGAWLKNFGLFTTFFIFCLNEFVSQDLSIFDSN